MKKLVFCFLVLSYYLPAVAGFLFLAPKALANDEIRNLQVDLKAKGFSQNQYYDNLDSSNIIFPPASQIQLQLTIKNLGNRNQTNIKVTGKLPGSITSNNNLVFTTPQIAANNDYTQNFILTIKDKSAVNSALTKNDMSLSLRSDVGSVASDSLYFYTNAGTKGATTQSIMPQTGPENILLGTLLSLGGAMVTLKARRLARGY